jgi:hypothetical protein
MSKISKILTSKFCQILTINAIKKGAYAPSNEYTQYQFPSINSQWSD